MGSAQEEQIVEPGIRTAAISWLRRIRDNHESLRVVPLRLSEQEWIEVFARDIADDLSGVVEHWWPSL